MVSHRSVKSLVSHPWAMSPVSHHGVTSPVSHPSVTSWCHIAVSHPRTGLCDVMSVTCPCPQATTRCPSVPCPHCHSLGTSLSSATSQCHPCATSRCHLCPVSHPGAILVPFLCPHVTCRCHLCPLPSWCNLCSVSCVTSRCHPGAIHVYPCHFLVPLLSCATILVPSLSCVPVSRSSAIPMSHPGAIPVSRPGAISVPSFRVPSLSHPRAGSPHCPLSPVPRSCAISVSPSAISMSRPHVPVPPPCPLNVLLGPSVTSPGPGVTPVSHPPAMSISMSLGHLPECHL